LRYHARIMPSGDVLPSVLLSLATIIACARGLGWLFGRLHQPPVVGEILAGILLGPSLLGHLAPGVAQVVLAPQAVPFLDVVSQVGVILFMFLVGLELDLESLKGKARAALTIAGAGILIPLGLGAGLAPWLLASHAPSGTSPAVFTAFLGVSLAVTAFPVLARIVRDQGLLGTGMGQMALTCAAIADGVAWCLLACVVGLARGELGTTWATGGLALGFVALMMLGVRPLVHRLLARLGDAAPSAAAFSAVFVALLLSALATERIGLHPIFGAFFLGAVIPSDSTLARDLHLRLETVVTTLLLPAFFACTGLRTQLGLLDGLGHWLLLGAVVTLASLGKFGGTYAAARLNRLPVRDSLVLGVLMNTRGLVELIVLNLGLDLGVLTPTLFTILVLMALLTTFAAPPLVHFLTKRRA
jgi:Kef-type K+ transport system membrane component KefB